MQELGTVIAHAFNDPEKLQELFKPSMEELRDNANKDPSQWDNDEWWSTRDA